MVGELQSEIFQTVLPFRRYVGQAFQSSHNLFWSNINLINFKLYIQIIC